MANDEGLSLAYRIGWRVRRSILSVFGPADLGPGNDPVRRLERERAERIAQARARREQS